MNVHKSGRAGTAVAFAVVLAAGLVSGCSSGRSTTGSSGTPLVGVDYPRSDTDFWNSYIRYVPGFASQSGVQLKTTNSQNDVANLIANVQTLISQGVKGVVMAPQDTAAIAPSLATLRAKRIPVVTIDTRPDTGDVYMVVRADNRAYGTKACQFLGTKLGGKGKVIMFEGDLASINGRDRTEAFNACMNKQRDLLVPPSDPKHVFVVSNDGIPEELRDITAGQIDATVSQPADLYARYGLYYVKAAIDGKTFSPGKTDHDSTIIQVRDGVLEDQLSAPLVTADGGTYGGVASVKNDDKSLWGNNIT